MNTHHEAQHAHRGHALRWVALGLVILLGAALVTWIVALLFFPGFIAPYPPGFYMPFFFPFGFIFLLFFLFFALRWIVAPWRWGWGWGYGRPYWQYSSDPVEILRVRYARGEITKEQFDQMMRDLGPRSPPQ